jgi:hypothetical protein
VTQPHSAEASTRCFVAIAVVGMIGIGVAVLFWPVSATIAVLLSLLVWPTIGWVAAVLAARVRFGRTLSLRLALSLLAATILKVAFLLFLTVFALCLSLFAVALVFSILFGILGTESVENFPWIVPLAASSIVLLSMIFAGRNVLWPLVREFWGVDTGEWYYRTDRPRFVFDELRGVQLDRTAKLPGKTN